MKKLFFLFLIPSVLFGQSWRFFDGENAFDGKFVSAGIIGKGYDSPYLSPKLVLTKFEDSKYTLYLNDTGYYPDEKDIRVELKFSANGRLYELWDFWLSRDKETIALESFINSETKEIISLNQMLDLFTKMNDVYMRVSDDYRSRDFYFSLSGSTASIIKVIPKLKDIVKDEKSKKASENILDNKIKERNKLILGRLSDLSITDETYEKFQKFIYDKENKKYYKRFFSDTESDSIYLKPKTNDIKVILSLREFGLYFVSSDKIEEYLIRIKLNEDSTYLEYLSAEAQKSKEQRENLISKIGEDFIKYKFNSRGLLDIAKHIIDKNIKYKDTYITSDGVSSSDYKFGYIRVGLILEDDTKYLLPNKYYRSK